MTDATEAARRLLAFDPTAPKWDEWNDDLTNDAIAVARALLAQHDEWQPITTAPRGGTFVLVAADVPGMGPKMEVACMNRGWRTNGWALAWQPEWWRPCPDFPTACALRTKP